MPESLAIRLRYRVLGGHVHCRLFTAKASDQTFAKSGDLVFRVEEWNLVREAATKAGFEFVPEDECECRTCFHLSARHLPYVDQDEDVRPCSVPGCKCEGWE